MRLGAARGSLEMSLRPKSFVEKVMEDSSGRKDQSHGGDLHATSLDSQGGHHQPVGATRPCEGNVGGIPATLQEIHPKGVFKGACQELWRVVVLRQPNLWWVCTPQFTNYDRRMRSDALPALKKKNSETCSRLPEAKKHWLGGAFSKVPKDIKGTTLPRCVELERSPTERVKRIPVTDSNR